MTVGITGITIRGSTMRAGRRVPSEVCGRRALCQIGGASDKQVVEVTLEAVYLPMAILRTVRGDRD